MSSPIDNAEGTGSADPGPGRSAELRPDRFEWDALAASPEFLELVAARRRFTVVALPLWLAVFAVFSLLAVYADGFMSSSIYESVKVGWGLTTAVILGAMAMPWLISRYADRVLDPLAESVRQQASAQPGGLDDGSAR